MESYPSHSNLVLEEAFKVQPDEPEKLFKLDIESWCYGLARFPEPLTAKLIHALIREMSGSFLYAVQNDYAFDLIAVAKQLHDSSEGIVNQKELALHLIACMPNPASLSTAELLVFERIISKAEKVYPDVVEKFRSRISKAKFK